MDIPLSLLFFILGILSPLYSAVIYYLSQDTINDLIETNYKAAQRLRNLKTDYDELINSFIIFEFIAYIISYSFLAYHLFNEISAGNTGILVYIIATSIFIIAFLLFRFLFLSLGVRFADSIAGLLSFPIFVFSAIIKPLTHIFILLNKSIVGKPNVEESRDEISELVESAHEEGAIEIGEYRILKNIMHFSEILVSDVMTPRTVMFSCAAELSVEEVARMSELKMYSRFPIWEGESVDDGILGYVMSKDVIIAALNGKGNMKLRDFNREVYFIPENAELDTALERFLNRRQHMFMVVDEYGGIEGLITMEDVLETILGVEIVDEVDKVVDLRQLAKQRRDSRIASL
ncbi:MAG: CBS domain-containing protein [Candidatus Kapabacteria bacterium]|nr:CBS domain-containing protein [Ignavibacteriota bacterium]MCW5885179.1 CBS domain-containing protein [Candidatus Kapabacteria bacterium]